MSAIEQRLADLAMRHPRRFAGIVALSTLLLTTAAFATGSGGEPLGSDLVATATAP